MLKINLQLFAEAIQGKKIVYLYRVLEEKGTEDGTIMAFTKENGRSTSKDAETTATKDGTIRTPAAAEIEISATSILAKNDTIIEKLEEAMHKDKILEIWHVNLDEAGTEANKFKAVYYQGYLTSLEESAPSDGFVEISTTFAINGTGAKGEATVSTEQQETAQYTFEDTLKTS